MIVDIEIVHIKTVGIVLKTLRPTLYDGVVQNVRIVQTQLKFIVPVNLVDSNFIVKLKSIDEAFTTNLSLDNHVLCVGIRPTHRDVLGVDFIDVGV